MSMLQKVQADLRRPSEITLELAKATRRGTMRAVLLRARRRNDLTFCAERTKRRSAMGLEAPPAGA